MTQGEQDGSRTGATDAGLVGVAGLGIMGRGMAGVLMGAGFRVRVWNRTPSRAADFAAQGAYVAASPAELAADSDIVLTCVADTAAVEDVLLGADGVAAGARPGTLIVDASTISPEATRGIARDLAARGLRFIDAPVSGGSEGAARGTLSVMVGGAAEDVERARPVLQAIGTTVTHVGPAGSGQACKLVNQVLVVVTMLGVQEALALARAGGLDEHRVLAAVGGGAGGSWMLANRAPQVLAGNWRPGFTVDLQHKDLRLVLEAAAAGGVALPATELALARYERLREQGRGRDGNHAIADPALDG